jgi:pyruvate dehydrogenase E1 component beta subunit
MAAIAYEQAIEQAMAEEMRADDRVFYMATIMAQGLLEEFGPKRVRSTPIAESCMTGMAIGAAGSGYRPIVGWGNVCFSFVAFDQIANQAAKIRYMFGAQRDFPIVFRAGYLNGTRSAAQHSQTGYALYAHAGGLKIAVPSRAADAKALMKTAIRDDNPVVFLTPQRLLTSVGEVPDGAADLPFGQGVVRRDGSDVTIVGIGYMVEVALEAAEQLAAQGVSAEVIDPRTLVPLDVDLIRASVQRTGRLVVVDESFPTCSFASEIAVLVAEDGDSLRALTAPIRRVCAAPVPIPFSPTLEDFVLPSVDRVVAESLSTLGVPAA